MRILSFSLSIAVACLAVQASEATIINVDALGGGDYLTIQEGVDAASEGDTVLVAPGTYPETVALRGLNVALLSEEGASATRMDPGRLTATSGEDSTTVVDGFTIANGPYQDGSCVFLDESGPTIRNSVIEGGNASNGAGAYCEGAPRPTFENVVIRGCSGASGVGVYLRDSYAVFRDCEILDCERGAFGGAVYASGGAPTFEHVRMDGITTLGASRDYGEVIYLSGSNARFVDVFVHPAGDDYDHHSVVECSGGTVTFDGVTLYTDDSPSYGTPGFVAKNGASLSIVSGTVVNDDWCVWYQTGTTGTIERSVLVRKDGGQTVACWTPGPSAEIFHSCLVDTGCGDAHDNIYTDPLFCHYLAADFTLHDDSPCLPGGNPWGVLMGHYGAGGCGTGVDDDTAIDGGFELLPPSPNPARGPIDLRYASAARGSKITVTVHDLRGSVVRRLARPEAGSNGALRWNLRDGSGHRVAPGVYFVSAECGGAVARRTVVVLR